MPQISIVCPKCKSRFKITVDSIQKLDGQSFSCPKCKSRTPFAALLPAAAVANDLKTHIGGAAPVAMKTNIQPAAPVGQQPMKTHIATHVGPKLIVQGLDNTINLTAGNFTLGRDSSDSRATIRIAPDMYMSRLHAQLAVTLEGNRWKCIICSVKDENPAYVNSTKVPSKAGIVLQDGDKIIMGTTTVVYKQ